ncbi:uncharacterized protein IWZ02DRAFT_56748 [Phyllosticta citriasiana]|uniref:uncharacterized protein n=1 Tax=Phyllosticta citriasiana TaxID=595635 RepID=UPI0030FD2903
MQLSGQGLHTKGKRMYFKTTINRACSGLARSISSAFCQFLFISNSRSAPSHTHPLSPPPLQRTITLVTATHLQILASLVTYPSSSLVNRSSLPQSPFLWHQRPAHSTSVSTTGSSSTLYFPLFSSPLPFSPPPLTFLLSAQQRKSNGTAQGNRSSLVSRSAPPRCDTSQEKRVVDAAHSLDCSLSACHAVLYVFSCGRFICPVSVAARHMTLDGRPAAAVVVVVVMGEGDGGLRLCRTM